ncbi:MAG: tetratricopeptide repeat protein [Chthoniobacterales bacterium]
MTVGARFLLTVSTFLLLTLAAAVADKKDSFTLRLRFKGNSVTYLNRGSKLLEVGDLKGARANFDAAIREDPDIWPAYLDRAAVSAREGKWSQALKDCEVAVRERPGFFRTFVLRAQLYEHLARDRESLADLNRVFSLHADDETDATALATRAELRAVSSDPSVRDPQATLADALRACQLNYWKKAIYIDTLATSYASGDFKSAVHYEEQAIASGKLNPAELRRAKHSLENYQQKKPRGYIPSPGQTNHDRRRARPCLPRDQRLAGFR